MSIRRSLAHVPLVAFVAFSLLCLWCASLAHATAYGELAQTGGFGKSAGQFEYPSDLAVDPTDNSVYVLDEPGAIERGAGPASFRIQKFSSSLGSPVASAEVATPKVGTKLQVVDNIAIDPVLHRLYVLMAIAATSSGKYGATEILAYSTETKTPGEALQPAPGVEFASKPGVFYEFPAVPPTGTPPAGAVLEPHGLAVEPKNHELLVLGNDPTKNPVIQQITTSNPYTSGVSGEQFDDTETRLDTAGSPATGIAIGPGGSVYVTSIKLVGGQGSVGVVSLAMEAPNSLANPAINVVAAGSGGENELTGGGVAGNGKKDSGAQVAVSAETGLIYAAQLKTEQVPASLTEEGSYEIRGMDKLGSRQVVFGGGVGGSFPECHIASAANAIGAGSGGVVYALDEGTAGKNKEGVFEPSSYGFHLVKFGSGGTGCPTPSASFTIDGSPSTSTVTVHAGDTVTFNASSSQLNGEEPVELQWDLNGSGKYETVVTGSPASLEKTLQYLTTGHYTIGLKILLKNNGSFGNPPPVTGTLVVEPDEDTLGVSKDGSGTGAVECSTDAGITFGPCASKYIEGTKLVLKEKPNLGSEFVGWSTTSGSAVSCESSTASECSFTINANSAVTATFKLIPGKDALTINANGGTGTGAVECELNASGTFGPCAASYTEGAKLVLKAVAGSHSAFTGWSPISGSAGACTGVGLCSFTIEADTTVDAPFSLIEHTLTVTPSGEGAVSATTGAISNCSSIGGTCSGKYPEGKTVTLKATPAAHYKTKWGAGQCQSEPAANECVVAIGSSDVSVAVMFSLINHTITVVPTGEGSISAGSGISNCSAGGGVCSGEYAEGETVILTATPNPFNEVKWTSGCTTSSGDTCKVTVATSNVTIDAAFSKIAHTLTVAATGEGSVSASAGPISGCTATGGACSGVYDEGKQITLTASPAPGYSFTGWSGGGCSGTGTCVISSLTASTTVTATFTANTPIVTGIGTTVTTTSTPGPPPPMTEGKLGAPGSTSVVGGKTSLRFTCSSTGSCHGTIKLTIKAKQGHKTKILTIGQASYSIDAGKSETVTIKLSKAVTNLLKGGKTINATLVGKDFKGTVKLKLGRPKK